MVKSKVIRGLATAWVEQGAKSPGKPLYFLIHGFPDQPKIWEPLMQCLGSNAWSVAPYLRGVEPSAKGSANRFGPTALAQDFLEIVQELDPLHEHKIVVVCHDIGSDAGWEFARLLKSGLQALVMLNGYSSDHFIHRLKEPSQAIKSWYMGYFQLPVRPQTLMMGALGNIFSKTLAKAGYPFSQSEWRQSLELIECYRQSAKFALKSYLHKKSAVEAPLYVLWGRKDRWLNIPRASDFDQRCTQSHLKVFDAGHWLQYEIPEVIHAELLKIEAETKSALKR
jgi:pimeloyl-ACP methyl ester carboxylesterase